MMFLAHSAPAYPLPAGVIGLSPWLDLTHSFPSARVDKGLDYLPNPWETPSNPKPSKAWPPTVPRYHFYSDIPLHPFVSRRVTSS
jgi:acetyl esterase/lipase